MKHLLYIALFLCLSANGQNIHITGKLLNRTSDTTRVQVWHEGRRIVDELRADPFYTLNLGDSPHYTIKFTSGSVEKNCFLICWNMTFDLVAIDIDFRSAQSIIIYKERKNSNSYTIIYYGSGNVRQREIKIYETN